MKFKQILPALALTIFIAGNLVPATPAQATDKVVSVLKKYGKQGKNICAVKEADLPVLPYVAVQKVLFVTQLVP